MIKLKSLLIEEAVMTLDAAQQLANRLDKEINAPYVRAYISTLGGKERPSVMLTVSLDDQKSWPNNILHNSRWMMFDIAYDGTIVQHARDSKVKNFRKSRFTEPDQVINKINTYLKT